MQASQLHDRIVTALVRQAGGTKREWRLMLGPMRVHSLRTHPHCNWSLAPSGGADEVAIIERLLDDLRLRHPHVTEG